MGSYKPVPAMIVEQGEHTDAMLRLAREMYFCDPEYTWWNIAGNRLEMILKNDWIKKDGHTITVCIHDAPLTDDYRKRLARLFPGIIFHHYRP